MCRLIIFYVLEEKKEDGKMVIGTSSVNMAATGTKTVKVGSKNQTLMRNNATGELRYQEQSFEHTFTSTYSSGDGNLLECPRDEEGRLEDKGYISPNLTTRQEDSVNSLLKQLRTFLLEFRNRLTLLIGRRGRYAEGREGIFESLSSQGGILDLSTDRSNANVWTVTNYTEYTYEEAETLNFATTGKVTTADGRTIEFDMEVAMSREYVETSQVLSHETKVIYTDPLVISLDSNPIGVSDQKWQFDIDGDGSKDNISMLSKGSGFLVFDKNNDGIINNGLEMFGAKTGNGFAELMEYDEDGNGWIDENDSIFSKLSVWAKDDSGEDKLLSLKEANVGAIYLKSLATSYALKSMEDNDTNAQIKRSGMYLTEDGLATSMHQLDLVKSLVS